MSNNIQFGHWNFDPDACRLFNDTNDCKLQPRIANLLEYFLDHPDQVHSHDQLIREVWQGRVVSDDSVRQAVSTLRQALAVDGSDRFIKTICKKGYRAEFPEPEPGDEATEDAPGDMPVEDNDGSVSSWDVRAARRGNHVVWATVLLLCIALGAWAMTSPENHPRADHGIAAATTVTACLDDNDSPECDG